MYYKLKIILMLSTVIPSLDCCSSRTLFPRKPINFYRAVEISIQKSTQFQRDSPHPSPLPPQLTTGDDQSILSYNNRHHHLRYDNGEKDSDEDDENLKLNRSQRSDLQNEEAKLEQTLRNKFTADAHTEGTSEVDDDDDDDFDKDENDNEGRSVASSSSNGPVEDAQYKLISEIVSIECVEWFRLEFCLNGGRCFLYPILNQSLSSCECAEGYVGERCEAKSYEFIPRIRPRFAYAKTIGGPLVFGIAVVDILFLLFLFCKNCNRD